MYGTKFERDSQRLFSSSMAPKRNPELGAFEIGFQSLPGFKKTGWYWSTIIFLSLTLATVILWLLGYIVFEKAIIAFVVFLAFTLTCLVYMYIFSEGKGESHNQKELVYIYSEGFVFEVQDKDGKIVESKTFYYKNTHSMDCYLDYDKSVRSDTQRYKYNFKVFDKGTPGTRASSPATIVKPVESFRYKDPYDTEFGQLLIKRLQESWNNWLYKKVKQTFNNTGSVTFNNITMSRDNFLVDGVDWLKGADKVSISSSYVTFYPSEPKKSKYYHWLKNHRGAWRIHIARMENKDVIIRIFLDIYHNRLTR